MLNRNAKTQERRRHVRYALTGTIPGHVQGSNGVRYEVVTVDVSVRGIGLLLEPTPAVQDRLNISFDNDQGGEVLSFEVRWLSENHELTNVPGLEQMRRCGLSLLDHHVDDLVDFLATIDCLQIEE